MCSVRSTSVNINTNTNTKANTNINKINIGPYHAVLNTEAKLVLGVWTLDLYLDHWGQDFVIGIHAFAFQDFVQLLYLLYT